MAADIITTVAEATGAGTDMAYTKDKDRQTRGVGAIASLDHALPNRQALRRRVLEDTKRHDRAMAAVTRGALGAVRDPLVVAAQRAVFSRTGAPQTGVRPRASAAAAAPAPARPKTGVIVTDHRTGSGGETGGAWSKLGKMTTKLGTIVTPPAAPDPTPPAAPATPATPATPTPPASSGGGGGGGGGGGRGPATSGPAGPAVDPLPSLPDIPAAAAEDNTTRNLLIAGGAALAAYLLFIRGRQ